MRKRKDTKFQSPAQQVAVKRADRVRMVSMPSEKTEQKANGNP
jgi:NADH-quinone oxidoreductase subunit J